ncbi:hypothetical protein OHS33_38795 (plasmid) [Streptomyces sp. NBC_00536]|uniref:hypothetical protein n=1 Tax=Streptomyces sp. NBC_00536 TaxID=2975769 RepID=UPI002E7FB48E|nr:hypothetical protein [Streptomyces sp. NBC_00536]WUC84452.1 hypothetical protein OHS33_38795 [Streptomyces sp. NBC_00536]
MNPPTQLPPPGHRAPKRRIARDLIGLFLVSTGTVGLLGALYSAAPLAALALAGFVLVVGGGGVLYISPPLHPAVRLIGGYAALAIGLWIFVGLAFYLTPWSLLFFLLLAIGVFLSSEEA